MRTKKNYRRQNRKSRKRCVACGKNISSRKGGKRGITNVDMKITKLEEFSETNPQYLTNVRIAKNTDGTTYEKMQEDLVEVEKIFASILGEYKNKNKEIFKNTVEISEDKTVKS